MFARLRLAGRALCTGRTGALLCGSGCAAASALAYAGRPSTCEPLLVQTKKPLLVSPSPAESTFPTFEQKLIAEFMGTAMIVLGGCGAVCTAKYAGGNSTLFGMAATWGIVVAIAVFTTRKISGAHLNPAVTGALVATDGFSLEEAPFYVAAQVAGATFAGLVNYVIFSPGIAAMEAAEGIVRGSAASTASFNGAFGMVPNAAICGPVGAFLLEVWMTGVFVFCVLAHGDDDSVADYAAPAMVGATVTSMICIFGPITGCGMNPARDIGPRLVTLFTGWGSAALSSAWVYTLGPLLGGVLGALVYKNTLDKSVTRPNRK